MAASNLTLLTDLYQLTMGAGYWRAGVAERRACFHLFFRRCPFDGGYAIAAGLEDALDYLEALRFDDDALSYLGSLRGPDEASLFDKEFLEYLRGVEFRLDIDALPEGTAAFPHEPLLRVEGPLLQAQLVETALLNVINFQTLIATKAARVCREAVGPNGPEPVLEFGLRRAQGVDGAMSATRASFVGGCTGTSNVLAGMKYGIPVKGTHAHAWVMAFGSEREAFERYAEVFPGSSVFLVDTFDTLEGVAEAIEVGLQMRQDGHEMRGVRLDSGDLAELSIGARALLDAAGFPDAKIVASNDLDEHRIAALKQRGARIDVWGVGTRLSTAYDQPALGGVYKLAAIEGEDGAWQPRIKLSENPIKRSIPGRLQVRRYSDRQGTAQVDAIYDLDTGLGGGPWVDPEDPAVKFPADGDEDWSSEDLLRPVMRNGARTQPSPPLTAVRERTLAQLGTLPVTILARRDAPRYPVYLDADVHRVRTLLTEHAKRDHSADVSDVADGETR